ncbi:MAG TPA: hypothetical protein VF175_08930 [Lacipirellula sp.]
MYRLLAVHGDTQVVIEGYPRSANTFAYVAFTMAQPQPLRIAHHLHSVGQVRRGVQLGIPIIVLIREPREAILSLAIRKELTDVEWAVDEYLDFHAAMESLTDRFVLAEFHEVIKDFGAVIRRLNRRFGTTFVEFEHTEENVAACYRQIDEIEQYHAGGQDVRATHVARPSADRQGQKRVLADQLEQTRLKQKIEQAEDLYRTLCQAQAIPVSEGQSSR